MYFIIIVEHNGISKSSTNKKNNFIGRTKLEINNLSF
jgi:hypothetical protein